MSKTIKEDCRAISIYEFNKWGSLKNDYYTGFVVWSNNYQEEVGRINYTINKTEMNIELDYKIRKPGEEDWNKINYTIPITKTSCHYGNNRYWFVCPMYKRGLYCGKRVAKMYLSPYNNYFVCRNCLNLSYQSRNENYNGVYGPIKKVFDIEEKIEKLEREIKIYHRNGRPTKKALQLEKLNNQLRYFLGISGNL